MLGPHIETRNCRLQLHHVDERVLASHQTVRRHYDDVETVEADAEMSAQSRIQ